MVELLSFLSFVLFWFFYFFILLPWRLNTTDREGNITNELGAPVRGFLPQKAALATLLALVTTLAIYFLIKWEIIDLVALISGGYGG